jgi:hypothetical protein
MHLLLDRVTDAKLCPQGSGDMGDAKIKAIFDLDITNTAWDIDRWAAIIVQNPADTLDQTLKRGLVQLIGTAEAVHHLGFDVALLGMADILGEGVVADG